MVAAIYENPLTSSRSDINNNGVLPRRKGRQISYTCLLHLHLHQQQQQCLLLLLLQEDLLHHFCHVQQIHHLQHQLMFINLHVPMNAITHVRDIKISSRFLKISML